MRRSSSGPPSLPLIRPSVKSNTIEGYFYGKQQDGAPSRGKQRLPTSRISKVIDKKVATFRWMKGELIGKGNYGSVYMAFNATTGEVIAVKQVEVPHTADDKRKEETNKIIEALLDERDTLRDLDHPNIVQYLGFEENPQTLNIFLQYISGGTIGSCLKKHGRFREEVTKHFTFQILEGLKYLHSKGIIHRDLKPDNVLVEDSGVCRISDFGISKKLADLQPRAHTLLRGTSFYMAPEIVSQDSKEGYDSKVDIWGLGCIVQEMWTAERPWHNEVNNVMSVFMKLNQKQSPPLPEAFEVTDDAKQFRRECFNPEPELRPSAHVLQSHPYLVLPPSWVFLGMLNMGIRPGASFSDDHDEVPRFLPTQDARSSLPAFPSQSGVLNGASQRDNQVIVSTELARPITPPLVYIDPPAPRKSQSLWTERRLSTTSESSGSHRSSQSASRSPNKRLVIYNPDEPNERRPSTTRTKTPSPPPFIFTPPPLPQTTITSLSQPVPYSSHLIPLQPNRYVEPGAAAKSSTPNDGKQAQASNRAKSKVLNRISAFRSRSRSHTTGSSPISPADSESSMTTDTGSDFSGMWKRAPNHVVQKMHMSKQASRNKITEETASSNASIITRDDSGVPPLPSVVGDTRPDINEVLKRFETFFPGHDLGQPGGEVSIDPSNTQDSKLDSRKLTMKSVKKIAEEQIGSPIRPRTQLWDSRTEEIKVPQ